MKFSVKKIVVACGLVTMTATAFAGSSVNVYGRVDASIASVKAAGERTSSVDNGGSYFGFKGVESLGNGLKAGFILESGFDADTGSTSNTSSFFGNRSELFLEGSFGAVRMGRFLNPSYYAVADRASLHNEDYGITYDQLYAYQGNDANRVAYTSPSMNGLTLESSISLHERAHGNSSDKNAYDLAANYDRGNWSFGAGFGEHGDAQQYALRATWTQDAWTVSGYHQRSQDVVGGFKEKTNVTRAAVAYAVGAGELHANYGHANAAGKQEANQWTVGYNHHLSKRTKVYAFYSQIQNKNGASFGDNLMANEDQKSLSIGVRHNF